MSKTKRILVTGATGKVGQTFIQRLFADSRFDAFIVRALCHRRQPDPHERLEIVSGSIEHRTVVEAAMAGVTHVVHLASVKKNAGNGYGRGCQRAFLAAGDLSPQLHL